jgi:hypothetical protein
MTTEAELVQEIESELRDETPEGDAARDGETAAEDFNTAVERIDGTTTEAQLVAEINDEARL